MVGLSPVSESLNEVDQQPYSKIANASWKLGAPDPHTRISLSSKTEILPVSQQDKTPQHAQSFNKAANLKFTHSLDDLDLLRR